MDHARKNPYQNYKLCKINCYNYCSNGIDVTLLILCTNGFQYWKLMMYILLKSWHLLTNVDLVEFQKYLSIIIRFGKQDLTYGIEAAWISHGLGLIWVLADVISKVHVYGTTIYRQPAIFYIKRASISNFLNFLLTSTINLKLHLWVISLTLNCTKLNLMYLRIMSFIYMFTCDVPPPTPTYKQPLYGCQPDEPQASLATTNRCSHVYVVLFIIL